MHPDSIQLTWLVVLGAALQLAVMGQPWRSRDALPIFFSLIVAGACVALGRTERTLKWARRHPAAATVALLVPLVLVLVGIGTAFAAFRSARAM